MVAIGRRTGTASKAMPVPYRDFQCLDNGLTDLLARMDRIRKNLSSQADAVVFYV